MLASKFGRNRTSLRSDFPLSDDQIRRVAPSIFAVEAHESRSARYTYIPTGDVLTALRKELLLAAFDRQALVAWGYPALALDVVLLLVVEQEEVVQRLLARGAEQGRSDDTEETIRRRLEVYAEQTAPLIDVYEQRGLVRRVDGMAPIDEVTAALREALGAR